MKKILSLALALVMSLSLYIPVFATQKKVVYDWDYDLAMSRGYLTAEDKLPEGVELHEGEIFIPAQIKSSDHADGVAMLNTANSGEMMTNGLGSDPWSQYSWTYLGVVKSSTQIDVKNSNVAYAAMAIPGMAFAPYGCALTIFVLIDALYDRCVVGDTISGYYNRYLYTASNPGMYPYIDYSREFFYYDSARTNLITSDDNPVCDWEYALLP